MVEARRPLDFLSRLSVLIDGIDVPDPSTESSDTAAWNYPACDRRPRCATCVRGTL